jgi:hypothetical protein
MIEQAGIGRSSWVSAGAVGALSFLLVSAPSGAAAGPSVAELLTVCDRAFAGGYVGVDAAACEWYAAPCPCRAQARPRWCLPASEDVDEAVRKVVAALRRYPDPAADVEPVVQEMLTRIYPCGEMPAQ